jgi:hypothetical protein
MATPEEEVAVDGTDAPDVSESLFGLVGALEKMKDDMGLTAEARAELEEIRQRLEEVTTENEELQRYAEDAILVRT